MGLWEHFSHLFAKKAGVNAASTQLIASNDKHHTLLSKRFDELMQGSEYTLVRLWHY